MAPALRLLLLSGLMCAARGLRIIQSPEFDCSQPEIQCRVLTSDCLDLSWLRPYDWTPTAPADLEVTAGIGVNDLGHRVPVLQINWTVNVDASIQTLQGAEISVLELSTSLTRCVQFKFYNEFPRQRDQNNQPWKFFYNKFEVNPGNTYHVSVQHLPKENKNLGEQDFTVPGCSDGDMMLTDTCCRLGFCWNPNISLDFSGDKLIVTFTPRRDAARYGVSVRISRVKVLWDEEIILPQGATTERRQVNFSNPVPYEPCWYNVSVWPYMQHCGTDCMRQWYAPACPTPPPPPPPEPSRRDYLWPIAAALTILPFTLTLIFLCLQACISTPGDKPQRPPDPPPLVKQKVLLVYSADHKLYVNVVIRLADFLRVAWGLDVVLDRHHSQEIAIKGVMPWLNYQKDQIDKVNGTILILCSKGAQAKWKARQNWQEARVTLPEDAGYVYGDLFTSALNVILPDFQKTKPYDRYVVAYFNELCEVGDIPSLFKICPQYALVENLQNILFRIQRIERHQPNVQYNVDLEGNPSYCHLVKAIEQCRAWQEEHPDWFERECAPAQAKEEDHSIEEQIEVQQDDAELTRRVYIQIRQPETSVVMQTPRINKPHPIRSVNPSLMDGLSSLFVAPLLNEEPSPVTVVQPSLNTEALRASYRQEPFLADVDESLANERLHQMDWTPQPPSEDISEDLLEAQRRFFCQSILEDEHVNPDLIFYGAESSYSSQDPRAAFWVDQEVSHLTVNDLSEPSDQGIQSMDLRKVQNALNRPAAPGEVFSGSGGCLVKDDESVHERLLQMDFSPPLDQDVRSNDLVKFQQKYQAILDDQHLAPDMVFHAESRLHMVYEHQPLLVDAGIPLPTRSEPELQIDLYRPTGQGSQFVDLRDTQKNWLKLNILGGQRITLNIDVPEGDPDTYEERNDLYLDCGVMGRTDQMHCHSEDLGYGTLNHNNPEAIKGE